MNEKSQEKLPQIAVKKPEKPKKEQALDGHKEDPFSYRHYNAYRPTCNKLLSKKWEDRDRDMHLKKLKVAMK
jgi:hypothetical protein